MEHKCEKRKPGFLSVCWEGGEFEYWKVGPVALIDYCPYCGKKLEPPKPEFDARPLLEAASALDKATDQWCKDVRDDLMERTERLFLGEDPEPPDKIEVSRKSLEFLARMARGIHDYVEHGPLIAAQCDATALAVCIEGLLADD